ncbi:uncharacterized protein Z520_12082 [Fonsecaea multimorphosa CBS 102226]|uniref:Xylanolytic transcriptional activator regulatory domain-containing protein n=1 Tax=Fonsecaea multimorphosa CBS 102226 TaxID=1442371 RepID=A0A0D2I4J9_9EURO|nr:uncharacterized protein Z520_12082 [Fonsecaea multimorphosa CBS 102226]KIX92201.1 hypothetical protein Z520_12082 [Fonsecaea multimorphosa CBS 102226]OAL17576.1 hypothetical protein AYO22_11494 [Fonsecaea multimorphosa]
MSVGTDGSKQCNRETPCMTCVLRGKQDSCSYGDAIPGRSQKPVEGAYVDAFSKAPDFSAQDYQSASEETWSPDLACFGYSNVNVHNSLGIVKKLENLELGSSPRPSQNQKNVTLCQAAYDIYKSVLKQLPCSACVRDLVEVFFDEVNWQYTILDRNYFTTKLEEYYHQPTSPLYQPERTFPSQRLIFSALLFQVLVCALQFLPAGRSENLHTFCIKGIVVDGDGPSDDPTMRLLSLLPKNVINLDYIAAQILRTAWLKNRGLIAEAWHVVAQATINAQEIGIHRDDGKLYATDAESACVELWDIVLRRRLMLNLYLWDSEMGMVLGKPLNFKANDYTVVPPTDCEIPRNRKSTAPFERSEYETPNTFTVRLLEYHMHKHLPQIRELELEGPYPRDYSKVERLHQGALEYIATIPAIYRFENPDTSFDEECPMLAAQREFFCATIWLFILLLHRPYIFSNSKSRSEIMKAGIHMLEAQQRFFETLSPHHYKMFTLTYLSVEPCVSMLAVLIAFPHENAQLVSQAFRCIKESLVRLKTIRNTNKVAGQGADVIQNLLLRAEKNQPSPVSTSKSSSPRSDEHSSELFVTPSSHGAASFFPVAEQQQQQQQQRPQQEHQSALFCGNASFGDMPDWSTPFQQASSTAPPVSSGYAFDRTPFRPVADLTYNDLAIAQPFSISEDDFNGGPGTGAGSGRVANEVPQQFRGDFGEGSFWSFVNRGST